MFLQQGRGINLYRATKKAASQHGLSLPRAGAANLPWLKLPGLQSISFPSISFQSPIVQLILGLVLGGGLGVYIVVASTLSTEQMGLLVVAALAPFLLLITRGIRWPLLAIIMIETSLDITSYVGFEQPDEGQISGYTVSLTTMALCGLYAILFAELMTKHTKIPKGLQSIILPGFCYVLFASVTAFWSPSFKFATFEVYQITHALLLFSYLVMTVRSREEITFIVLMLGVGIIIQSFGQSFVFATGKNINIGQLTTGAANTYIKEFQARPGGFIGSPIDAAGLYEIYLPLLFAFLLTKPRKIFLWFVIVAIAMGILGLALAQSRMGWMMIIFSCGIVSFFAWRRGALPLWIPVLAIVGSMIMLFAFQDLLLSRFTNDDNGSARSRVVMMELGFKVLHDHPFFGVGINNFAAVVKHYLTPEFGKEWFYAIHNKYVLLWVEVGIPGLVTFVWFLFAALRRSWSVWRRNEPVISMLGLALGAGILGQMLHMFVDVFHSKPQVQALWISAALIAAMYHNFKTEKQISHE